MSRKIKGSALDSKARIEDDKARLRHQSLLHDYVDLQKEVDGMRSQLDAATQRKLVLAAEVRFLRRRRRCLMETKTTHLTQEPPLGHDLTLQHQTKSMKKKKQPVVRKEAGKRSLPLDAVTNPKKKQKFSQQVPSYVASQVSNRAHKRTSNGAKEASRRSLTQSYLPMSDMNHRVMTMRHNTLDLNLKQKTSGATMRNPDVAFDLNTDGTHPRMREPSLRAPIFDLNEISTGDEDFYINVDANKFEESTKGVLKDLSDEQPSDLKLSSICRNSGEGTSSRVGKRKISWQDPVALRV